jgi:threonyl-tRNA synthetase
MAEIHVTLPDGSVRDLPAGATAADLAATIGKRLAKDALVAVVDGEEHDLVDPLPDHARVEIVTPDSERGLVAIRHSTAHVLAQAVLSLFPGATYAIGPPIEHGFYYDFELPGGATFSQDDLARIEAKMREIIASNQPFERHEVSAAEGAQLFRDHPYKREIIERVDASEISGDGTVSYYRNSDDFIDLCRGPHVPSTGRLGHFALQRVAGAYWRGDHTRPMLQRIYGTAWASEKQLKEHLHRLEEAEKRDHRRLATELDLVSWPEELGPGLAVWHPKGALVRKLMEDNSRTRHQNGGYEFVY